MSPKRKAKSKSNKSNSRWSRGDKLSLTGIFLTVISVIAAIVVIPEIRNLFYAKDQTKLEIVDISLGDTLDWSMLPDEGTPNLNSYLDIKLRNTSEEIVFIKRIDINVEDSYLLDLYALCQAGGVEISEYYDIELPLEAIPTPISKEISQEVPANGVDRFVFFLKKPFEEVSLNGTVYVDRFRVYQLKVKLLYNTSEEVSSKRLIIFTPAFIPGCNFMTEELFNNVDIPDKYGLKTRDIQFFQRIDEIDGKKSNLIQNLIKVAKGECYLLAPGLINQPSSMECSGKYIQMDR